MRTRLTAFVTVLFLAAVPVLANVCDLSCEIAPSPAAPPSCHEQAPREPAGGSHSPRACSHDHDTIRAARRTPTVTIDAMGAAAVHALVHNVSVSLPQVARTSSRQEHSPGTFAPSRLIPLRI